MSDKLSWLDRLIIKIALAKSVARGHSYHLPAARMSLASDFVWLNSVSDTSPTSESEAPK